MHFHLCGSVLRLRYEFGVIFFTMPTEANNAAGETLQFIRERRTQEGNFEALQQRLEAEIAAAGEPLKSKLQSVQEKEGANFLALRQKGGSAWPEFEQFVTAFERALL
jgi:hypothetical protein